MNVFEQKKFHFGRLSSGEEECAQVVNCLYVSHHRKACISILSLIYDKDLLYLL